MTGTGWRKSWVTVGSHDSKCQQTKRCLTTACTVGRSSHCDGIRCTRRLCTKYPVRNIRTVRRQVSTRTQHDYLTRGQRVKYRVYCPTCYCIRDCITSRRATAMYLLLYISELQAPVVLPQCTRRWRRLRAAGKTQMNPCGGNSPYSSH